MKIKKSFWLGLKLGSLAVILGLIGLAGWFLIKNHQNARPLPASRQTALPQLKKISRPDISDFGLNIPKIEVWAPIIPQVDGYNKQVYLASIQHGVAQFHGSKNPDQNGNLFIFGHSAYYKNKPGDYKEVFKNLSKLKAGDQFKIYFKKQTYTYRVFESKKVSDKDWSIIDPTPQIQDDRTVTLMTCYPPGTLRARWVVFARQTKSNQTIDSESAH